MKYRKNSAVIVESQGDYVIFFDTERGLLKKSNEIGFLIWRLCDGKHDDANIAEAVLAAYPEADPGVVYQDVRAFLQELQKQNFVAPAEDVEVHVSV